MTLRASRFLVSARTAAASPAPVRAILTLLCILTFGLQGFVAQTHVHPGQLQNASIITLAKTLQPGTAKLPLPAPVPDDPSKCPLCHVAASLSSAIGVATTLIILPASGLAVVPAGAHQAVPKTPPSFVWRNRGPPRA